ncbi:MAG TPA: hypothetical protein VF624_09815 [Tepidisphaeraceae bacterium]|jgi:hypothetical protein
MHGDAELLKLTRHKSPGPLTAGRIGDDVVDYFKSRIEKQQRKFGSIGEQWLQLVPERLQEASELSTFSRGTLGITVANSTTLYGMKQAMLAGLQEQLIYACRAQGLKKITLKVGRLSA